MKPNRTYSKAVDSADRVTVLVGKWVDADHDQIYQHLDSDKKPF